MASFEDSARIRADEGSRPGARGDRHSRAPRALIADLTEVGYELSEQHLQMISGGARADACYTSSVNHCDCDCG
jgi:hypothetical protein